MSITASLEVHGIPEILQFLGMARSSGFLTVTGDGDVAGIAFRYGRVLYARTTKSKRLGEALVEMGVLTEENLGAVLALQRMKKVKQALGPILLELGLGTREALEEQVAEQCRKVLADVMTWKKGSYRFEAFDVDDAEMLLPDGIETTGLVLDSLRAPARESDLELVA
jgi:hypothetical protein